MVESSLVRGHYAVAYSRIGSHSEISRDANPSSKLKHTLNIKNKLSKI